VLETASFSLLAEADDDFWMK